MSQAESTRVRLEQLLRAHSRLPLGVIQADHRLGPELGFDSHAMLSLLLDVEDQFDLEWPADRVAELRGMRFEQLVQLLDELKRCA
jgi:acyl carrier protein